MPFAVIAPIVGAIGGALISSSATGDAADTQANATTQAAQTNAAAQAQALAAQQPFLNAGYAGVNKLQDLLGLSGNTGASGYGSLNQQFSFDPSQLATDPGYQYTLAQGQKALDRKQAAGGGFYSGEGLQQASALNQGLASTEFNDAYNRQLNQYQTNRSDTLNPLQALAGEGQTSANQVGNTITGGANALSSLLTSNANAQGAASIAGANSLNQGINNGLTSWQRAQYINQIQNQNGTATLGSFDQGGGSGSDYYAPITNNTSNYLSQLVG